MADTLESLEIEIKHSATGAADEVNKVTKAVQELGKALDAVFPNLKKFSGLLRGSTSGVSVTTNSQVAKTINNVTKVTNEAAKSTRGASAGFREMIASIKGSLGPMGKMISSLKRVAFYRIIRTIIKEITQAFKEGLESAYLFSDRISTPGHRFAQAMDSMASATLQMKNQLGSAFISLMATLEPLITKLVNLITRAADAVSQFFAAFTGSTYLKASAVSEKFSDAMEEGAKGAKEWKNQLMGFDVINRLEAPSDSGSTVEEDVFEGEDSPIEDKWMKLAEKVKSLIPTLEQLKQIAEAVGVALLGWKVGELLGLGLIRMRTLQRNKSNIYYALYQGTTEVVDDDGNYTGEQVLSYSTPVQTRMNVSGGRGKADVELFGLDNPFTRTAVTGLLDVDFGTDTIFWYGVTPGSTASEIPHNYKCTGVSNTKNQKVIALREVDLDAEDSD